MQVLRFLFPLLLLPLCASGQFFVVKVEGDIFANQERLERRSRILPDATVTFGDASSFAHILSPTQGHFVLAASQGTPNGKGEFFAALREALITPDQFYAAATRSNVPAPPPVLEDTYDLKDFFRGDILLMEDLVLQMPRAVWPRDPDRYFAVRHRSGEHTVGYRLTGPGDTLFLPRAAGKHRMDGKLPERQLVYVNASTGQETTYGPFRLLTPDADQITALREEVALLREHNPSLSEADFLRLHALPYVQLYYGKCTEAALLALLP